MKNIILMILLLISSQHSYADQKTYKSDLKYKYYNSVWKTQTNKGIFLKYDESNKHMYMYIEGTLTLSAIELDRNNMDEIIQAIEKYNAWNKKASKKGVTLEKEITKIKPVGYFNQSGETWYFGSGQEFSIQFFSQNKKTHQLVLMFPNVTSRSNQFIKHKINTMYFTYKQANVLKNALADEAIKNYLIKHDKQKAIESEFN